MTGQTISHYKILEKLGEGGMGVVYKAQDTKLDRVVALKFLPSQFAYDEEDKQRFIHEAKAASSLDHPNICTFYEIGETDQRRLFIAMAFYDGTTVKDKIKKSPLPLQEAVDIAISVAQGLAKAHEKQIVHRDIKSDNIMVTSDGMVKIMDFGLARMKGATTITKAGATVGTVPYMSPEQARGEKVDHRSDIWSLGVVLYEMITGQHPFKSQYKDAIVYSILNENPQPVTSLRSGLPMELERILNKAMQKDRANRYQHAIEMLTDLKSLRTDTVGISNNQLVKSMPRRRKHIYLYGGTAGLFIIFVLIALYLFPLSKLHPVKNKSVAVLPFVNMSSDKEDEYFSDGITEELINVLSKLEGLNVAARTSSFVFKGKTEDISEIGRQLHVSTVLEGSVRRAGNKLRITAELIDVGDGFHLWSETYEREMRDVFAIQDEISRAIASSLKIKLVGAQGTRFTRHYTENTEAFQLYLKGRYYWNKRTPDELKKGIEYFTQAIDTDPNYALAYTGISDSYQLLAVPVSGVLAPMEAMPKAKEAASKALEIDTTLAEAHTSLAHVKDRYDWDWAGAETEYKRAMELNPNYATAHHWYSTYLTEMGRFEEAIAEVARARQVDPLSFSIDFSVGWTFYFARQYDKAIDQCLKVLAIDQNVHLMHWLLGQNYLLKKQYTEAIAEFQKSGDPTSDSTLQLAALAQGYAAAGERADAQNILNKLLERSRHKYIPSDLIALIYLGLHEKNQALAWLEKAYQERSMEMVFLNVEPMFDPLRSDPRFKALLEKMGLEQ